MATKQVKKTQEPKIQYATTEQVKAAAKLAFIMHGPAFRELAKR